MRPHIVVLSICSVLLVKESSSALPPDCAQLEDGFYEHEDGCKDLHYKCESGVRTSLACGSGLYFHQPTSACVSDMNTILSCKCNTDGYHYVGDINACVVSNEGSSTLNWVPAYQQCAANAQAWFGSAEVYGRLINMVNDDMSVAAKNADDPSNDYFIGMRALSNSTAEVRADYFWWLTEDNENAVKPVLLWTEDLSEVLATEDVNDNNRYCMMYDQQRFINKECDSGKDFICEYLYNKCEVSDPCIPPKVCVPDSQWKSYCVCPAGSPATEDCGAIPALPPDCSQLEDGFYEHEKGCKDEYYKCEAGVDRLIYKVVHIVCLCIFFGLRTSLACGSGLYFHQPTSSCVSDKYTIMSCKCMLDGFQYVGGINSCVVSNEGSDAVNWVPAYQQCAANALAWWGSTEVFGRLIHIVNDGMSVAAMNSDSTQPVTNNDYFIGMRALSNSTADVRANYFWWLTEDNENAVKPVLLWTEDLSEVLATEDVNDNNRYCMMYDQQRFINKECNGNKNFICEYLYNKCDASNPCVPPKVCVPDSQWQSSCVCPAGSPATENCRAIDPLAPDCSQLEDGLYEHEDGCKDMYYKCEAGVRISMACGSGLFFHQPSSSCVSDMNTILSCKCMLDGYQYVGDINSCVVSNEGSAALVWDSAYQQCEANAFAWWGSTEVYGRLVHIVNDGVSVAARDSDDPSSDYFIGMRALSNSTAEVRADYFWWLTKDNENAVKPVLLWTEDLSEVLATEDVNDNNRYCMMYDQQRFINKECDASKVYICEYLYDKCQASNPCGWPNVCVPDGQWKTLCVCPAGSTPSMEYCGLPTPCDSSPCENGATCTPMNATHYDCACDSTYYGNNCEFFCDNTTVISSPCSRTCDHGVSYIKPPNILDAGIDQCHPQPYSFTACGQSPCEAHTSPEFWDCMSIGGFYTISSCYLIVTSSTPFVWVDAWGLCAAQGATLAIIPDTDEALDAVYSFILDKAPDQPVWVALKASTAADGSIFASWMSSESASLGVAVKDHDNQEGCIMIGHAVSDMTSAGKRMMTMPCHTMPVFPATKALCMKRTRYARFYTKTGYKLQVNPMWGTIVSMERNAWMCGLACRRSELCVAHAFQEATGTCELYEVKEGMPQTITSGTNVTQVYATIADSGWNLYNRLY